MIGDVYANCVLVSTVAVPLIFWARRRSLSALFRGLRGGWQFALVFVVTLNVVAAVMHLQFGTRILGERLICWSGIVFLLFIWARTIAVVRSHQMA